MYLDHRILAKISRIFDRIEMSVMLLDNDGKVILPRDDHRSFTLPEAIRQEPSKPLLYGGFTLIGTDDPEPMFLCLAGNSAEVCDCALLTAEMVNMLASLEMPVADAEQTYRCVIRGDAEGLELETIARENEIEIEKNRLVMLIYIHDVEMGTALNILRNVINEEAGDAVVEIDCYTIALIKTINDPAEYDDMDQLGQAIDATFVGETSHEVYIGVGEPKETLALLGESYREAKKAIDVGRAYRGSEQHVYIYRNLLLERFISELPADMCANYNRMMFNRRTARLFNEEMLTTIEKFFENSLNLSETARQIYIHRNTLVYRLDKVQRMTGLDLRLFDDAVTFKFMMMLGRNAMDRARNR